MTKKKGILGAVADAVADVAEAVVEKTIEDKIGDILGNSVISAEYKLHLLTGLLAARKAGDTKNEG